MTEHKFGPWKYEGMGNSGRTCEVCGIRQDEQQEDWTLPPCKPAAISVERRHEAAEEVCHTLLLMMALGGLQLEKEWRDFLGKPMQVWSELATATGVLQQPKKKSGKKKSGKKKASK